MAVIYNVSIIWKLINEVTGMAVDSAEVNIKLSYKHVLNKGSGFYSAVNLSSGEYVLCIAHKDYEYKEFLFNYESDSVVKIESIILRPKITKDNIEELHGVILKEGMFCSYKRFYYGILKCTYKRKILSNASKGSSFIKVEYDSIETADYRKILIQDDNCIYKVSEYNYLKKGYYTDVPFKNNIKSGKYIVLLNESTTDLYGQFSIPVKKSCFISEKETSIIVFSKGRIYIFDLKDCNIKIEL